MFDTPEQLLRFMQSIEYSEFTRLMSPLEVIITQKGSCHDQTLLELQELYDMGLNPKAKFIIAVDAFGQGLETHSFVYYETKPYGVWSWFENAWGDMRGIHKYLNEGDLMDAVLFAFGERIDFDKLYIADFIPSEHTIGENLSTLVDICMETAEEYFI